MLRRTAFVVSIPQTSMRKASSAYSVKPIHLPGSHRLPFGHYQQTPVRTCLRILAESGWEDHAKAHTMLGLDSSEEHVLARGL